MERLYYYDSYLKEFDADVVGQMRVSDKQGIVLDRTAFYPTSGGQPNDTGSLNGIRVIDVIEEGEKIIHILEKDLAEVKVHGIIDWRRRLDHMQQHTGQHILSQAFIRVMNAETIGFHMGDEVSTIDLNVASIGEDLLWQVEDRANSIIQQDLRVQILSLDEKDVKRYALRKDPERTGPIRVIEIEEFDLSACGGTHLNSTGEVGLIKIRKSEKVGSKVRIDFYCGMRALSDYRWKNSMLLDYANKLTVGEKELGDAIERLESENKSIRKELKDLMEKYIGYEAAEMLKKADTFQDCSFIHTVFEGRDLQEVKILSSFLREHEKTIVLFAIKGEGATLIFSRSDDIAMNISSVLKRCVERFGGKGGGRPESAQGGIPDARSAQEALDQAFSLITSELL